MFIPPKVIGVFSNLAIEKEGMLLLIYLPTEIARKHAFLFNVVLSEIEVWAGLPLLKA